ncbi:MULTISPECIES: hypothetical protein [unclassified Streptomyces]|uniref:hypothetical protein n=1 Tax=unclassified Streptomyces TaxID=2593676 RepID=UPI0005F94957|nr:MULTISPECIES: hypothetical protein [unclassified Streptomyces]KJY29526.1 hypothetical protein VR45_29795 [Streptomyces sp. NRRL S-495]KOV37878.1 hypothetical protein ADK60_03610 [Streptomyces sp. XY431]
MNHLRRALRGTAHLVTRLCAAVEHLDTRADAALRARLRPLVTRLADLVRRMAAANCGDALARHLPCRARDRNRDHEGNRARARRRNRSALDD